MRQKYAAENFVPCSRCRTAGLHRHRAEMKWSFWGNHGTMGARSRSSQNICQMTHAMNPADQYRIKAGDLAAYARAEPDPFQRAEYERLPLAYLRLADQAERNSHTDVVYETPPTSPDQPQAQQQQQAQPAEKS